MTNELEPQRTSLDPVTIHADLSEWIIKVTGETNAITKAIFKIAV